MDSELETLVGFLDAQRHGVLRNLEGLDDEALRRAVLPSGWSCLGLVQHLTLAERYWLRWAVGGEEIPGTSIVDGSCRVVLDGMPDPDDDWLVSPDVDAAALIAAYRDEATRANAALAGVDLDGPSRNVDPPWAQWFGSPTLSARWIVVHMIEETAQHAGHADVVRELLDADSAGTKTS